MAAGHSHLSVCEVEGCGRRAGTGVTEAGDRLGGVLANGRHPMRRRLATPPGESQRRKRREGVPIAKHNVRLEASETSCPKRHRGGKVSRRGGGYRSTAQSLIIIVARRSLLPLSVRWL